MLGRIYNCILLVQGNEHLKVSTPLFRTRTNISYTASQLSIFFYIIKKVKENKKIKTIAERKIIGWTLKNFNMVKEVHMIDHMIWLTSYVRFADFFKVNFTPLKLITASVYILRLFSNKLNFFLKVMIFIKSKLN